MTQILIVEDETRIAAFIEKGLRAKGYSTFTAVDSSEALDIVLSHQFDLALSEQFVVIR